MGGPPSLRPTDYADRLQLRSSLLFRPLPSSSSLSLSLSLSLLFPPTTAISVSLPLLLLRLLFMAASPPSSCRRIDGSWTVSTLIAAYLDLALAYLLLCFSTLAYVAATSLSVFGLSLPCSCSWSAGALFRRPPGGCLQGFLGDYPLAKVAGVHSSVRRRFPFDSDCGDDGGSFCRGLSAWDDVKLLKDRPDGDEVDDDDAGGGRGGEGRALLEMGEGMESSSGSVFVSKPGVSKSLSPVLAGDHDEKEKGHSYGPVGDGVEFKGNMPLRESPPKLTRGRRRPRRSISLGTEKSPISSPPTPLQVSWKGEEPVGINPSQPGVEDENSATLFTQNIPGGGGAALLLSGSMPVDNAELTAGSGISEASVISELKQALEEEKRALAALSLDLENERNSAATAVNEAMAMILRVQEEKAAIEMEARQYKRMVEEKSAYDDEEMEILKEIIICREREKHMLEKEVEAYRQMMVDGNDAEQPLFDGIYDDRLHLVEDKDVSLHSIGSELTLNEIYKSMNHLGSMKGDLLHHDDRGPSSAKEHKYAANSGDWSYGTEDAFFTSLDDVKQRHTLERLSVVELDRGVDCSNEEKGPVIMKVYPSAMQTKSLSIGSTSSFSCEGKNVIVPSDNNLNSSNDVAGKRSTPTSNVSVLDVHAVDDKPDLGGISNLVDDTNKQSNALCKKDSPRFQRSNSDIVLAQSPSSSSQRTSWLNLRRTSMPYVDNVRSRLENEVDILRKRLKLIRQGRERIGFSAEPREKEDNNLRLLEEISCQLQGIKKATEPGKSAPRIPLPPSSQGNLKKKRSRSVSLEPNESN